MTRRTRTALTLLMTTALLPAPLLTGAAQAAAEPVPPLVCTSDRDGDSEIWFRATDGSVRRLTSNTADDYGAVWSPDGRRLAFVSTRDGDREVFVMNATAASASSPATARRPTATPPATRRRPGRPTVRGSRSCRPVTAASRRSTG